MKLREPVSERRILVAGNRIFSGNCNRRQSYSLCVCSDGLTPVVVSKGIILEILKVDLLSGFLCQDAGNPVDPMKNSNIS